MNQAFTILAGTANPALAAEIARKLGAQLGACAIERFPDGEISVRLLEPVRHRDVFLVQPTSPPVNDHVIELLALADACRRASAAHITAIVPYFGYSRSDKRHGRREPIAARMIADLLQAVGIRHVVTVELHAPQIEGFFHYPVDSLTAVPVLSAALRDRLPPEAVVVSPDAGRVRMATDFANRLGTTVVVLHKRRVSGTETTVTHLVGDVRDRPCLIVDDMIATGGTLLESVETLLDAGARPEIFIAATHGLFVGEALERLRQPAIREVLVTDSIAIEAPGFPHLRIVSIAPLLTTALRRFLANGSISDLC